MITLLNGDRFTGRIIAMEYGKLQLNSAHAGDVSIEWPSIRSVSSQYPFRVEQFGSRHYAGTIETSADGKSLLVNSAAGTVAIPQEEVAAILPYESSFWQRIYGSVALGASYTKSSQVSQGSFDFNARYGGNTVISALSGYMIVTRDSSSTTNKDQLTSLTYFQRPDRDFWGILGEFDRDQSVGIDGRLVSGLFTGRHLYQSSSGDLLALVGLDGSQEWAAGNGTNLQSVEGVFGGEWHVYKFSFPKLSLDSSLLVFPSITDAPRWRSSLNISLSVKLSPRFAIQLSEFGTYDSKPPEASAAHLNWGFITSLSYAFGTVVQ